MLNLTRLDWLYAGSAAGALGVAALVLFLRKFWRRDPEEIERRRREYVGRIGRIAHAEILEIVETDAAALPAPRRPLFVLRRPAASPRPRRLLVIYRYMISGVSYEAAQDLTGFASDLLLSAAKHSASVKYEPTNPSNSILAAENWSGLRWTGPGAAEPGKGR